MLSADNRRVQRVLGVRELQLFDICQPIAVGIQRLVDRNALHTVECLAFQRDSITHDIDATVVSEFHSDWPIHGVERSPAIENVAVIRRGIVGDRMLAQLGTFLNVGPHRSDRHHHEEGEEEREAFHGRSGRKGNLSHLFTGVNVAD